ncbi:hypothetical protein [Oceanobacillus profundus]|nr:hypothetical protein [Oceanobacillus profundus]
MAVKKRRGPDPIVIPKKLSEWINGNGTNAYVNNFKKGGGKKQK